VQQQPNPFNPIRSDRPPCPKCGAVTTLERIEPADERNYDQRTFQCAACGHRNVLKMRIKY
jgi:DNA-directed RNA polymerase subunit RPC12/RpoP